MLGDTAAAEVEESHVDGEHSAAGHDSESHGEGHPEHRITVTSPAAKDVTLTQQYVCQIHSCRHIEVCALDGGYLQSIGVREGQAVKQGDVMFTITPTLYQARLAADQAEVQLAQVEYDNTAKLLQQDIVSVQKLKLAEAKLLKAKAQASLAQAELNFTEIKAPFDGIVDRLHEQQGSLVDEGAMLTTLSDNSTMWVYFNVPEARYLEYQAALASNPDHNNFTVELMLANHKKFDNVGTIGAIEADFNNETGNIAFRADFPNPNALLRHGQTGTVLINRVTENAIVIPQRATFEILAKTYAYVVDENNVVRQRELVIANEKDDIFVIESGLSPSDRIVLEGVRQVRDGEKVEYEYVEPDQALASLKYHAE
ncbi:MAG: efflux RND transporter periplasmic adaptor subunit [Planctomycetales bacterium]|nr:efflux RND transporter periplasmic adaptor subunit [Planctomycetales bacterium]